MKQYVPAWCTSIELHLDKMFDESKVVGDVKGWRAITLLAVGKVTFDINCKTVGLVLFVNPL